MNWFWLSILSLIFFYSCNGDTANKTVAKPPPIEPIEKWGLGVKLVAQKSNNVNYEWYIDQETTGRYYNDNCGPTVATMAIHWVNETYDKSPLTARKTYVTKGGWWYTSDVIAFLHDNGISNYTIKLSNAVKEIKQVVDSGNIAILCIDMFYIPYTRKNRWHRDKFYKTPEKGWGHFIIVKGYKKVDKTLYFEVYDPKSYGNKYRNKQLKGKDRYYTGKDVALAIENWWSYAIVIPRSQEH